MTCAVARAVFVGLAATNARAHSSARTALMTVRSVATRPTVPGAAAPVPNTSAGRRWPRMRHDFAGLLGHYWPLKRVYANRGFSAQQCSLRTCHGQQAAGCAQHAGCTCEVPGAVRPMLPCPTLLSMPGRIPQTSERVGWRECCGCRAPSPAEPHGVHAVRCALAAVPVHSRSGHNGLWSALK